MVRFDHGSLARSRSVRLSGNTLSIGQATYVELNGFSPPVHVYRRQSGTGSGSARPPDHRPDQPLVQMVR